MELTTVAFRLGWRVSLMKPLLMLVEFTYYPTNKKPTGMGICGTTFWLWDL